MVEKETTGLAPMSMKNKRKQAILAIDQISNSTHPFPHPDRVMQPDAGSESDFCD